MTFLPLYQYGLYNSPIFCRGFFELSQVDCVLNFCFQGIPLACDIIVINVRYANAWQSSVPEYFPTTIQYNNNNNFRQTSSKASHYLFVRTYAN